jgi:hypothetical protein
LTNVSESEKFKIATQVMVEGESAIPLILRINEIFVEDKSITKSDSLRIELDALGHIVADRYTH